MPAYYFAMEGYNIGEIPDPAVDKLITIQYQKIDLPSGEPLGELKILKEWEGSEKSIVTTFYNLFFKPEMPVTHFIPVGMSLDYEYEMIISKFKKYNLHLMTSHELYYKRPRFDLKPIIVLLNDGRFTGARLDSFSSKKCDENHVQEWYENKDFTTIERYIREEAEGFLKLLQYLNKNKYLMGITKKGGPAHQKTAQTTPVSRAEKAFPSHPKSHANAMQTTKKPADSRTPTPRKSSAGVAKAQPRSSQKSLARTTSAGQRSSVPLGQLRKHTPTKKHAGKRE